MAKVLVPLADGFEEIEAVTVIDVLRRGGVEVVTASVSAASGVRGAHGLEVKADRQFSDAAGEAYDAIILPGGGEGTENLGRSADLISRLRRQADAGRLICAICAAPMVLAAAGLLPDGVQVTCYPTCQMDLDRPWASAPVVHDGSFITGQAPGTSMLFALVILQTLAGAPVAQKVARGMVTNVLAE